MIQISGGLQELELGHATQFSDVLKVKCAAFLGAKYGPHGGSNILIEVAHRNGRSRLLIAVLHHRSLRKCLQQSIVEE